MKSLAYKHDHEHSENQISQAERVKVEQKIEILNALLNILKAKKESSLLFNSSIGGDNTIDSKIHNFIETVLDNTKDMQVEVGNRINLYRNQITELLNNAEEVHNGEKFTDDYVIEILFGVVQGKIIEMIDELQAELKWKKE